MTWCRGRLVVLAVVLAVLVGQPAVTRAAISDEFVPGVLRQGTSGDDALYVPEPECTAGKLTVCIGCKTVKVCIGSDVIDNPTQLCPAATPYCNRKEDTCSVVPDHADECKSEFQCTGEGRFPNPYSCDSYYYCEGSGMPGDSYVCPKGYTYNSNVQLCHRYGFACSPAVCSKDGPIFNAFATSSPYFFYCKYDPANPDASPQIIVFSCGVGAWFDAKAGRCAYKCIRDGLFPKQGSPNSYYQCYFENGRLISREQQCKPPLQFDETKKICVTKMASDRVV